ncbi:methyl-accepting chemotaxis protein [Brevibacillus dissolubilis]|uniref:methyl-accepting chemotaxis protein n=1 Tax=Brevibacillus dissolubilis TaxID=1844116 RepID=UPI001116AA9F|nr:methyl-accepting chemotaxis protein [Brevibacillus dissolubilis]
MGKISTKMMSAILGCCLLIASLVGGISIYESRNLMTSEMESKLLYMAKAKAGEFSLLFEQTENAVENLGHTTLGTFQPDLYEQSPSYLTGYLDQIDPVVLHFTKSSDGVLASYVFLNPDVIGGLYYSWYVDNKGDGQFTKQTSYTLDLFREDNPDMAWYYQPIREKKGVWSQPYTDPVTNMNVISYTLPIFHDGRLIGVAGIDYKYDTFKLAIQQEKVYDTGYAFLVDQDYRFLVHPTFTLNDTIYTVLGGQLSHLGDQFSKADSGIIYYELKDQPKVMGYQRLQNGWILGVAPPIDEVYRELDNLTWFITLVTAGVLLVASALAYVISRNITRPLTELLTVFGKAGEGDFTVTAVVKTKDETGKVAQGFQTMTGSLRDLIGVVKDSAESVSAASEQLHASALQSSKATQEITVNITGIAEAMSDQTEKVAETSETVAQMVEGVERIAQSAQTVHATTRQVKQRSDQGSRLISEVVHQMQVVKEQTNHSCAIVNDLQTQSQMIGKIINVIESIAKQTNLLALNAAIESARAGEAGKGFAVVAQEVRKLAEQTSSSTKEIAGIISQLQVKTNQVMTSMTNGAQEVEKGVRLATHTGEAFSQIQQSVDEVTERIESITQSVSYLVRESDEMKAAMEQVGQLNYHNTARTHDISAASEQQLASLEQITSTSQHLADMAQRLLERVDTFKV